MYLGNAFCIYVGAVMTGMSMAVAGDRERYRTLKSIYVAPIDMRVYLIGRGAAGFVTGSAAVLISILFGVLFLHVHINIGEVHWLMFFTALLVGVVMLAMMGLALASTVLLMVHQSWVVGEGVASALFLFTGAIFPLEVLPQYLRPIGLALPLTYWLELLRRSLVGHVAQEFPTLSSFSDIELLAVLMGSTVAFGLLALGVFSLADRTARRRGLIDRTTNY